jgi:peptidoglycan/xylan/chitin deacetylase (PgdA/CDA1 family)
MINKNKLWNILALANQRLPSSKIRSIGKNGILNYHSISTRDVDYFGNISPNRFRQDIEFIAKHFEIVDLPRIISNNNRLKKRIALTFDDGYENFYTKAVPILEEFNAPATVFVNPSLIGDTNRDRILNAHTLTNPSSRILMDRSQLQDLVRSPLITIGNHTATHSNLSKIQDPGKLREEIVDAQNSLEDIFGITVNRFSYPYGSYNDAALDLVSQSHDYAVGTSRGLLGSGSEPYRLPRIDAHKPEYVVRWEMTDLSQWLRTLYNRNSL